MKKNYMKIKSDMDDVLPLNKTIEIYNAKIAVRAIFYENNKYYQQVFLEEYLLKTFIAILCHK